MRDEKNKKLLGGAGDTDARLKSLQALHKDACRKAGDEAQKFVPDKMTAEGIYIGQWEPKDKTGKSLGKVFNVFAAPEDLQAPDNESHILPTYFWEIRRRLNKLKNWHGFDGVSYANERELHAALVDGSYKGEWTIPTIELIYGKDIDGNLVQPDNLYTHKDKGDLKGTFAPGGVYNDDDWYWSCTEDCNYQSMKWASKLHDGHASSLAQEFNYLNCRPVRFVEIKKPSSPNP